MPKKDSLHKLIHSLNSTEKRNFKLHIKTKAGLSERLFDIINEQKEYNEQLIIKKLKSSSFCKNLSQNKNYLKGLILKTLRNKNLKDPTYIVNNLISEQYIFADKSLFAEQLKAIIKAKRIANKYELFALQINLLDIEMQYLVEHNFKKSILFLDKYIKQKQKIQNKIKILHDLTISKNIIYISLKKYGTRINSEQLSLVKKEKKKYNLRSIKKLNSYTLSKTYYNILTHYYTLTNKQTNKKNQSLLIDFRFV